VTDEEYSGRESACKLTGMATTFRILRLSGMWRTLLERDLASEGLSVANMRLLAYLNTLPEGVTQRELARAMNTDTSALVRLFVLLEKDGLVRRETDIQDRRANRVFMTPAGEKAFERFRDIASHLEEKLLKDVEPEARKQINGILDVVLERAGSLYMF
jgi:MarR family transcriptional regulator for hemolysin